MTLAILWYWLVGAIFTGYAVLDGFDLGVGLLHLAAPRRNRRVLLETIGPVWDGNEVWLVVGGGTLFAAFPAVYASVLSGFYFAFILLLLAFILRAAAIEFRDRRSEGWWQQTCDVAFWIASVIASAVLGLSFGNILHGLRLDPAGDYLGSFLDLLNPYAMLVAATAIALFVVHGATYLMIRTTDELQERAARWARMFLFLFIGLFVLLSASTVLMMPKLTSRIIARPWIWLAPLATAIASKILFGATRKLEGRRAFIASSVAVVSLLLLGGLTMYPVLVFAEPPTNQLTLMNAASTPYSLGVMLVIACIGLPVALCYFIMTYRVFRGKVTAADATY